VPSDLTIPLLKDTGEATRLILGVEIANLASADALGLLFSALASGRHMKIAFCNAHTANLAWSDAGFRQTLGMFTVFPDGVGVDIASRWLWGQPFRANLNGTDFVPRLLTDAPRPLRVAMIGSRPGVAVKAAGHFAKAHPRHVFGPVMDGFQNETSVDAFLAELAAAPVDILLVAMGNPLQEAWIARHVTRTHATLAIGVGALFDFMAGEVSRAPGWVRSLRLEWAYRLALEPRRLFRRYMLGNPLFLLRVLVAKAGGGRP
jgi:exopolysaccharide biosynthesis WecB/TagA/CpsF family protein